VDKGVRLWITFVNFTYGVSENRYQIFTIAIKNVTQHTKIIMRHTRKTPKNVRPLCNNKSIERKKGVIQMKNLLIAKCECCEDNYRLEELDSDGYCSGCIEYTL